MTPTDILQQVNYYVNYDYRDNNIGNISINWLEEKDRNQFINWTKKKKTIYTSWDQETIKCPEYAVSTIAEHSLRELVKIYRFPYKYVNFKLMGNPCKHFFFDVIEDSSEEVMEKSDLLYSIYDDIRTTSFSWEHCQLAREFGLEDGFVIMVKQMFKIKDFVL